MTGENGGKCPKCGDYVDVDKFCEVGDVVFCSNCDAELEIRSIDPVKFRAVGREHLEEEDIDTLDDYDADEDMDWDE